MLAECVKRAAGFGFQLVRHLLGRRGIRRQRVWLGKACGRCQVMFIPFDSDQRLNPLFFTGGDILGTVKAGICQEMGDLPQ